VCAPISDHISFAFCSLSSTAKSFKDLNSLETSCN